MFVLALALGIASCGRAPVEVAPEAQVAEVAAVAEVAPADMDAVRAFSASRPLYEQPLADGFTIPEGLTSLSAESCGGCHRAIYDEWRQSTHAHAWVDAQYQAELAKGGPTWMCHNCHTPLRAQQERLPVALVDGDVERPVLGANPHYEEALRDEGITCASCHVRDGVVHGPGLGGEAPHPVAADPGFRGAEVCVRCHQAEATYPGKDFVCTFTTGEEWAASPAAADGKTCLDCHMPRVQRPAAEGGPVRTVGAHWWRGAGIPKVEGVQPPVEANPPGLEPRIVSVDAERVVVAVKNARAGHLLPTGDPERWVQVDVAFLGDGGPVGEPWSHRIGQRWKWWPEPEKLEDNRLKPGEERTLEVPVPDGARKVVVTVSSHRMTFENAAHHELGDYPLSVMTHRLDAVVPR